MDWSALLPETKRICMSLSPLLLGFGQCCGLRVERQERPTVQDTKRVHITRKWAVHSSIRIVGQTRQRNSCIMFLGSISGKIPNLGILVIFLKSGILLNLAKKEGHSNRRSYLRL